MPRTILLAALLVSACGGALEEDARGPIVTPPCAVGGGCASRLCSEDPDVFATCDWRPEYACYRSARCEPQPDGACGWTPTPELLACLESPPNE